MCLNLQAYEEDSVSHGQNTLEQEKEIHPYTKLHRTIIRLNLNLLLLDWTLVILLLYTDISVSNSEFGTLAVCAVFLQIHFHFTILIHHLC